MLLWKGSALAPVGPCAPNRTKTILDIWDSFCLTPEVRFSEIPISSNKLLFVPTFLYIHCFQRILVNCDSYYLIELNFDAFALYTFKRNHITKTRPCNIQKKIGCKNENFHWKNFDIFLIFAQNIDCGYTLEPPHRGGSNEYPQSMFWSKNKKNRYTPANPSFTI